jgi:carbohydrate-selective porin OprB
VGALSDPIDDADADDPIYVNELWLGKTLLANRLELRGGLLEQQTVFDRNACANSEDQQFMATFLDNDPLVPLPDGPGAVLIAAPFPWLDVAAGAVAAAVGPRRRGFAGSFEDLDGVVGQLELTFRARLGGARALPGSYRLGVFVDGRERPVFGEGDPQSGLPAFERGHPGVYASFDQLAFREAPESEQGLSLFARLGWADPDTSPVAWFWSFGLQYRGALPGRDADVLGLGSYQAIASGDLRRAGDARLDRETGLELYYRIEVLPWLFLTPDVQYVVDPGATGGAADAVVAALRFRMSF